MDARTQFAVAVPGGYFVDAGDLAGLQTYLHQQGWLSPQRRLRSAAKAGEGNMNLVLRLLLDDGSTSILKQARPWVEKFPQVPAPAHRAEMESSFYQRTAGISAVALASPTLLQADQWSHIVLLEDLGVGGDLSTLYQGAIIADEDHAAVLRYMSALHGASDRAGSERIVNSEMRALNAEHMFRFPFSDDNGFDLDAVMPGMATLAQQCRDDAGLMQRVAALEARYLAGGNTLLHGDLFPGSVLRTPRGIRVIDPEFCFHGDAEFDVGVWLAHMHLAGQPDRVMTRVLADYMAPPGFSVARCHQYAGVEILRRLLGLAQLPLQSDLAARQGLVARARDLLRDDD